jgi:hypothetical protein
MTFNNASREHPDGPNGPSSDILSDILESSMTWTGGAGSVCFTLQTRFGLLVCVVLRGRPLLRGVGSGVGTFATSISDIVSMTDVAILGATTFASTTGCFFGRPLGRFAVAVAVAV